MAVNSDYVEGLFVHPGTGECPENWMLDPGQKAPAVAVLIPKDEDGWLGVECGDCGKMLVQART